MKNHNQTREKKKNAFLRVTYPPILHRGLTIYTHYKYFTQTTYPTYTTFGLRRIRRESRFRTCEGGVCSFLLSFGYGNNKRVFRPQFSEATK